MVIIKFKAPKIAIHLIKKLEEELELKGIMLKTKKERLENSEEKGSRNKLKLIEKELDFINKERLKARKLLQKHYPKFYKEYIEKKNKLQRKRRIYGEEYAFTLEKLKRDLLLNPRYCSQCGSKLKINKVTGYKEEKEDLNIKYKCPQCRIEYVITVPFQEIKKITHTPKKQMVQGQE